MEVTPDAGINRALRAANDSKVWRIKAALFASRVERVVRRGLPLGRPRRLFNYHRADLITVNYVNHLDVGLSLPYTVGDFLQVQIIVQHTLLLECADALAALL